MSKDHGNRFRSKLASLAESSTGQSVDGQVLKSRIGTAYSKNLHTRAYSVESSVRMTQRKTVGENFKAFGL